MKRSEFLKNVGIGSVLLATGQAFSSCMKMGMMDMSGTPALTVSDGIFTNALQIPETLTSPNALIAKARQATINAKTYNVFGYREGLLGPTIRVQDGQQMNIKLTNGLSEHTNVHWHGLLIPANMDGHPEQMVLPTETFDYQFLINQQAGTNWYHPHIHGSTGKQVTQGLAGLFIVESAAEKALGLPSGTLEIPLVIQDKRLSGSSIQYNPSMMETMSGFTGDTILVNGTAGAFLNVATCYHRFRILNGSSARMYNLALSNGKPIIILGADGGFLAKPESVNDILLAPGERLDILIDFSNNANGTEVFLESKTFSTMGSNSGNQSFKLLKFVVNKQEQETFTLPKTLIPMTATTNATKTRKFALTMVMSMNGGMHRINGKVYNANSIEETVNVDTTEIWEFDNSADTMPHVMHFHGVHFQVLDRKGGRNALLPHEKGWKDTVVVAGNEVVRVITNFKIKGKFVLHCHILEHEDDGMMINFEVK
jgi:FtsP/CotA-like multicopper oxidase with cupredoxin domain